MKLRRYSRHEMLSLDLNHENACTALARELKDAGPNPETICALAEMDEKLRRVLEQLSPKQRSAMQMCELNGFSTREAANSLGISTNILKSRVSRARGNLSLLLRDVGGTRLAAEAAPVVDRKSAVGIRRSSSEHSEASVRSLAAVDLIAHPKCRLRRGGEVCLLQCFARFNHPGGRIWTSVNMSARRVVVYQAASPEPNVPIRPTASLLLTFLSRTLRKRMECNMLLVLSVGYGSSDDRAKFRGLKCAELLLVWRFLVFSPARR
jgi:predicted DNA-binding protein (UPF0251 family)